MQISTNHIIALTLITTGVFLIGALFMLLFIYSYNKRKKQHREEKRRLQLEFDAELARSEMEVREHTLKAIAADIHDSVGQLLSLSKMTLSSISLSEYPPSLRQKVDQSSELLDISLRELKHLTSALYAQQLPGGSLESAITWMVQWFTRAGNLDIRIDYVDDQQRQPSSAQRDLILYRLTQELLHNIVQHARATEVRINLRYTPMERQICIRDNGRGFDVAKALGASRGVGLHTLSRRAGLIGGAFRLESIPGQGTEATIQSPY